MEDSNLGGGGILDLFEVLLVLGSPTVALLAGFGGGLLSESSSVRGELENISAAVGVEVLLSSHYWCHILQVDERNVLYKRLSKRLYSCGYCYTLLGSRGPCQLIEEIVVVVLAVLDLHALQGT